ncbi:SSI family serine proteinase inhibitor [Allonocardiopsis opalescens]|uniref:Subtilisin inhibitor-like n=1 Tax=Allonocardiopsis opalescens TaxID=1144618 RepID=A0A2T0Q711_9ACTN|nr:SSI family serine proteinase inhibitor [Allonocardiopsis opalescens]PRX99609.1 subtilisin inhibitor-like [Allonocardiopsis opalescens]
MTTSLSVSAALAGVALTGLLAAGCGGSTGADPQATASSASPSAAPPGSASPSPSNSPSSPSESASAPLDGGEDEDGGDGGEQPAGELTVEVSPNGENSGASTAWTLTCDPAAGDHPSPQAACDALAAAAPDVFAPVSGDSMCTMIHGGPQTATITGTWNGTEVDASFNRQNGCEIDRWDRLAPVLAP